jgi:catechol 2,3-dioxygenase-like lactoylglutathione lyase family enzyme
VAIPVLRGQHLERALRFYVDVLGAAVLFREGGYAAVRWQEHVLHLSEHAGDGALGAAVVLDVGDVDAVFTALQQRGYRPPGDRGPVFTAPTDQSWGTRELYVSDPDGNVLRFTRR